MISYHFEALRASTRRLKNKLGSHKIYKTCSRPRIIKKTPSINKYKINQPSQDHLLTGVQLKLFLKSQLSINRGTRPYIGFTNDIPFIKFPFASKAKFFKLSDILKKLFTINPSYRSHS